MRVKSERDESPARARAGARSFGETLARLRNEGTREDGARAERRREAVAERRPGAGDMPPAGMRHAEGAGPEGGLAAGTLRASAQGPHTAGTERDGARAAASTSPSADAARGPTGDAATALPPLRELVRALPPAIHAAQVGDGRPLELSFGAGLRIDLRVGREGVELTLRPDVRLARAAAAELPELVRALSAKGIRLARAGIGSAIERHHSGAPVAR
jgi:hypothetical protein